MQVLSDLVPPPAFTLGCCSSSDPLGLRQLWHSSWPGLTISLVPGFLESLLRDLNRLEMNSGVCHMKLQPFQPTEQELDEFVGSVEDSQPESTVLQYRVIGSTR